MILVVKLGGKVLEDAECRLRLARQIAALTAGSHRLVVVHGGGGQLSELCRRLGIPVVQHQGRRVTDPATLEAATLVFAGLNRQLAAALLSAGTPALGLAAYDGGLLRWRRRPPLAITGPEKEETIDFGLVGEVIGADTSLLTHLWEKGLVPVIACLGCDEAGQILNVNADTVASELAVALRADRLISVSDVEGIYLDRDDPSTRLGEVGRAEVEALIQEGRLADGMVPKVKTALRVLEGGVGAVQIISGLKDGALIEALEGRGGTTVTAGS